MSDSDPPPTTRQALSAPPAPPAAAPETDGTAEPARPPRLTGLAWLWAGLGLALVILAGGWVGWLLLVRLQQQGAAADAATLLSYTHRRAMQTALQVAKLLDVKEVDRGAKQYGAALLPMLPWLCTTRRHSALRTLLRSSRSSSSGGFV